MTDETDRWRTRCLEQKRFRKEVRRSGKSGMGPRSAAESGMVGNGQEWSGMLGSESGVVPKGTDNVFRVIRDQGFRSGSMQGEFKTEWEPVGSDGG